MNNNSASSHSIGIKCEICFEDYDPQTRIPQSLPCGHTICTFCLNGLQKKCPTCRTSFQDNQVHKNYTLVDLLWRLKGKEECITHKREVDRFCKSCMKLMCSVCHCQHNGSPAIISDMNLRDEIEMIKQTVIDAQNQVRALGKKAQDGFQAKVNEIEKKEADSLKKAEENLKLDTSRILSEKDELIRKEKIEAERRIMFLEEQLKAEIEKITKKKKAEIEDVKKKEKAIIEEVKNKEKVEIESIQTKHRLLLDNIVSKKKNSLIPVQARNSQLLEKTKSFDHLKTQCDTLRQCENLYQLWEQEKSQTAEILKLNQNTAESLFGDIQEEFQVGDDVDFCYSNGEVLSGKVIQKPKDQIQIQLIDGQGPFKMTININDKRLIRRCKEFEFLKIYWNREKG